MQSCLRVFSALLSIIYCCYIPQVILDNDIAPAFPPVIPTLPLPRNIRYLPTTYYVCPIGGEEKAIQLQNTPQNVSYYILCLQIIT